MAGEQRQFDRRFWKIIVTALVLASLLTAATLTLVHFIFGRSSLSRFLFEMMPPMFAALATHWAMQNLRRPSAD